MIEDRGILDTATHTHTHTHTHTGMAEQYRLQSGSKTKGTRVYNLADVTLRLAVTCDEGGAAGYLSHSFIPPCSISCTVYFI